MKTIALALLLSSSVALSQPVRVNKTVFCDKTDTVMNALTKDYQETSAWIGVDEDSETNYTVLHNPETKTWTLIQFNRDVACVLGNGGSSTFVKIERQNGKQVQR
jgi:hypothetical protein